MPNPEDYKPAFLERDIYSPDLPPDKREQLPLPVSMEEVFTYYKPTTSLTIGTFFDDAYSGPGTAESIIDSAKKNFTDSPVLPEAQWKESDFYRDGLKYYPGMTEKAAEILAERNDRQRLSSFVSERANLGQNIAGFLVGGIGGTIIDPVNAALMIAVPNAAVPKALAGTGFTRLFARGAYKGAFGNLAFEPAAYATAYDLQEQYGVVNTIANISLGGLAGGITDVVGDVVGKAIFRKKFDPKIQSEYKVAALDNALGQIGKGNPVNVDPIVSRGERVAEINKLKLEVREERFVRSLFNDKAVEPEAFANITIGDVNASISRIDNTITELKATRTLDNATDIDARVSTLEFEKQQIMQALPRSVADNVIAPARAAIDKGINPDSVASEVFNRIKQSGVSNEEAASLTKSIVPESKIDFIKNAPEDKKAKLKLLLAEEANNIKATTDGIIDSNPDKPDIPSEFREELDSIPTERDVIATAKEDIDAINEELSIAQKEGLIDEDEIASLKQEISDISTSGKDYSRVVAATFFCMTGGGGGKKD